MKSLCQGLGKQRGTFVNKISDIVVYSDGELELKASVVDETIWLTQKQLGELFGVELQTVNYHIKNIFKQKELERNQEKFRRFINEKEIICMELNNENR